MRTGRGRYSLVLSTAFEVSACVSEIGMSEIRMKHGRQHRAFLWGRGEPSASFGWRMEMNFLLPLLLIAILILPSCGGSSSSQSQSGQVAGNWQFTMAAPSDNSFLGGLQGGFLLESSNNAVTGAVVFAIQLPPAQPGGVSTLCNSGSAPVTGTISGQNVTLNVAASPQTFALTGTLSSDGTTMMGMYNSTDGQGCGTAQTGLQWSATLMPSLTGSIQGNFHSLTPGSALGNQDFPITGSLVQGPNIGASNATVTGTLNFQSYPCLPFATVNGQISGNSVILQVFASNGLNVGQIGAPVSYSGATTIPAPVSLVSSSSGTVLQGTSGYGVSTSSCPAPAGALPGDTGNVCLALGNATACTQPITVSPASIAFPAQQVGSAATTQTITLTNTDVSSTPLSGLSLSFKPLLGTELFNGLSDFDGLPNFSEQDNCASTPGASFNLNPQQSCTITISFSPQQSCPWLPSTSFDGGEPPVLCPYPLAASLTVNSPVSADSDNQFAVPITGTGFSAIIPSTGELDYGAEALGEMSVPQALSFINQGANPVQILPALSTPCVNPKGQITLPRPALPGAISGLQVDQGGFTPDNSTILYNCDSDLTSMLPNFQISGDTCSGTLLAPQASCGLQITFVPQPTSGAVMSLDYFLELNTLECTSTTTSNCEIDSGRFPLELKTNVPSPLRITPSAGLNFGTVTRGQISVPQTVTLYNDPNDPNARTINFAGTTIQGSFSETDDCVGSLASGSSCTVTVTFSPTKVGLNSGTITIAYTVGQTQIVYLRGMGQ